MEKMNLWFQDKSENVKKRVRVNGDIGEPRGDLEATTRVESTMLHGNWKDNQRQIIIVTLRPIEA